MFSIDFRPNGGRGATDFNFSGSITLVIPSLTTLQSQLEEDCRKFGFTVVNLNKVVRHGCTADLVPCTLYETGESRLLIQTVATIDRTRP